MRAPTPSAFAWAAAGYALALLAMRAYPDLAWAGCVALIVIALLLAD